MVHVQQNLLYIFQKTTEHATVDDFWVRSIAISQALARDTSVGEVSLQSINSTPSEDVDNDLKEQ